MSYMSELHRATLIMDVAAVLILLGIIVYTDIYRKRGLVGDRLYFDLLLVTLLMGISDAITYIMDGSSIPFAAAISIICNNIFFLTFELFSGFLVVYLDYRVHKSVELLKKRQKIIMIPALAMSALILINNVFRFLYWVDPATNEYYQYPLYTIIYIGPLIYAVYCVYLLAKIDAGVIWLFLLLIAIRVFLGNILSGVSSTALVYAMGLCFIHLHYMRLPFYDGEEEI